MWKSNSLVSNFHTHPPGIRNHRFTKLNKRTSNENHQRDPFQKSSNYIYIFIYIIPPKKNNCKVWYFDNKTFPLLIKIPSTTTKPPFFPTHNTFRVWKPEPLWRHEAVRCTRCPCHFQAESHLTFTEDRQPGGKVERWFRLEDPHRTAIVSKCPWMEPPHL